MYQQQLFAVDGLRLLRRNLLKFFRIYLYQAREVKVWERNEKTSEGLYN